MQSWSAAILCYNEAGTIAEVVTKAYSVFDKISGGDFEIIVVDDGSTDGSAAIVAELPAKLPLVKPVIHGQNQGIGAGLRSGYFHATKENVIIFSGDGQFDSEEVLAKPSLAENEFVGFYRKENTTYTGYRVLLSYVNKKFNHWILGLNMKDVNWAKAYKRQAVLDADLRIHSSLVESEICAKLFYLGYKCTEIESHYHPRVYGESKGSNFRIVIRASMDMIKLAWVVTNFKLKNKRKFKK